MVDDLSDRDKRHLETVLDETCRELLDGGDHAIRKFVAERLLDALRRGRKTIGELRIIASKAVADFDR